MKLHFLKYNMIPKSQYTNTQESRTRRLGWMSKAPPHPDRKSGDENEAAQSAGAQGRSIKGHRADPFPPPERRADLHDEGKDPKGDEGRKSQPPKEDDDATAI